MDPTPKFLVEKLLKEVRALDAKRVRYARESRNKAWATLLHSEIFRLFAIIDVIMTSCSQSERLELDILTRRNEYVATQTDLNKMAIPSLTEQNQNRPQQPILTIESCVDTIQMVILAADKVAHMQLNAFLPPSGLLGGLEMTAEFDQAYKFLKKNNIIEFDDMLFLAKKSEHIREYIIADFEERLRNNVESTLCTNFNHVLQQVTRHNFINETPLPTRVTIRFQSNADFETFRDSRELRIIGRQIWSCRLIFDHAGNEQTDYRCMRMIRRLFGLMPNLRHVEIDLAHKALPLCMITDDLPQIDMPELPGLESLFFSCTQHASKRHCAIGEKLLLEYSETLRRVKILPFSFPSAAPQLRRLETENISLDTREFNRQMINLIESPLKYFRMNAMNINGTVDTKNIMNVLESLSHFHGNLTEVELNLHMPHDGNISLGKNIFNIFLPKLKKLVLQNFPLDLVFLLQFPTLEHLTLSVALDPWSEKKGAENFLSVLWDVEEFYKSDIWKMLPYLGTIVVIKKYFNSHGRQRSLPIVKRITITRQECIAFQQNADELSVARLSLAD